jgi:hypothetical protein
VREQEPVGNVEVAVGRGVRTVHVAAAAGAVNPASRTITPITITTGNVSEHDGKREEAQMRGFDKFDGT